MPRPSKQVRALTEHDLALADDAGAFFYDPVGFVRYAYPWGEAGGPLERWSGPDDWQIEVLRHIGQAMRTSDRAVRVAISSGHGIGKEINHLEPVYTPTGPVAIRDLRVGDTVLGGDGKPCKVLGVYPQGVRPLYRVTFSDGASVLAGDPHQWLATSCADRAHKRPPKVVTTEEIRTHLYRKYQIPMCGAARFDAPAPYIHPYVLGYVLGNGSLCTSSAIKVACHDPEVYERIAELLPAGYALNGRAATYRHISRPGMFNGDDGGNALWREFEVLGLTGLRSPEKFVPERYLRGTVEDRIELLRGLMDADGCCVNVNEKGRPNHFRCVFNTSSERLRDDFVELVQSLGGTCVYNADTRRKTEGVRANFDNYQLSLNLPKGLNPFYLRRKADVYDEYESVNRRGPVRVVRSVEYEMDDLAVCIAVDSLDHTYLTRDYIVTHNTAFFSMLIDWFMSTRKDANIVATSNTKVQLQTKLWRELALWHKRSLFGGWFEWMATSYRAREAPATWVANAIPWSETNPEAFAGLHGEHVLCIIDEASAVHDIIWETLEGALTTEGFKPLFVVAGNPTRSSGGFYRCFTDARSPWKTFKIDSRKARMTNKAQLQEWIDRWGAESNFAKVRIYGQFPTVGDIQFIPSDDVDRAMATKGYPIEDDYLVFGVDVARAGSDSSTIARRRSNLVLPTLQFRIPDLMVLASKVADEIDRQRPDTVFVDGNGLGAGLVDRLRQLGFQVIDVIGQAKPNDTRYYNKRAECYGGLKEWLRGAVSIPYDQELRDELVAIEYDLPKDRVLLEDKDDIRERLGRSPDKADGLALTFAEPINVVRDTHHAHSDDRLWKKRQNRDWRIR